MSGDSDSGLSGKTGWLVVAILGLFALGIPAVLLVTTPTGVGSFGLYVAIAMLPAIAFGVFGVWSALQYRKRR